MKNIFTKFGAVAVALAMSGAPAVAFAENTGAGNDAVQVTAVESQTVDNRTSAGVESTREGQQQQGEVSREQQKQSAEVSREAQKQQAEASREQEKQQFEASRQDELDLELEDDSDRAVSSDDLVQKIEVRKHQLEQEVASSTPDRKDIVENANPVRLAVHALLASRDLLDTKGGIGAQVSEIAKQVNDSVASTTKAEVKIQSRGFLTRLLFGGDSTSAEVIAQEAAQNQARIDSLNALLAQANVSADVQATLNAQITALKDAQARLQALADREQKAWGLFSWRF